MLQKDWSTRVFLITIILLTITVQSHTFQPFNEAITNYTKFFQVSQQIQLMKNYSSNFTFNSTRQKYMFVFYPLMGKCVQGIQEEYEAVMQSIQNSGIGAATFGVLVGTKIAVKAGIWKFGFASLIKAAALSTLSMSALPVVVGVGAASYIYKNYKKQQVKYNCRLAMNEVEDLILRLQLQQLKTIQQSTFKQLQKNGQNLNYRIKVMNEFPQIYQNFLSNVKKYKAIEIILRNYFKNFIKIARRN